MDLILISIFGFPNKVLTIFEFPFSTAIYNAVLLNN